MRDEICKKSKVSWPKTLKKWFSVKNKAQDFHADDFVYGGRDEGCRNNFSEKEACAIKKSIRTEGSSKRTADCLRTNNLDPNRAQVREVNNYRVFVATWNVAGKSPTSCLNLEDWLHTSPPADLYVLGFQEIVPLNAGNVLGTEDNGPAKKWVALIRKTLNNLPGTSDQYHAPSPIEELDSDFEEFATEKPSSFSFNHRRSFQSHSMGMAETDREIPPPGLDHRYSVSDRILFGNRFRDFGSSDEDNGPDDSVNSTDSGSFSMEERDKLSEKYSLVASKQMVGIYLTVWVKTELRDNVGNMKVSCVGRGLMGYLGNKGSISISMSLHETSFCFICSHLTSGQKEGDELRRNSDVIEILRKTRFPRVQETGDENSPQTILDHDRIIWLGDLNYRIALSYRSAKALVERRNWTALLENDQLRIEQRRGRVFNGWNEGSVYFPPTYKYSDNSDRYAGYDMHPREKRSSGSVYFPPTYKYSDNSDRYAGYDMHPREKRRTPAWCDRILWYGTGLHQMSYVRGESRFSDHRPVYSIFLAEVESIIRNRFKKNITYSARIQVEELLPYSRRYGDLNLY